jgi:DNA polymerase-3 subunit gamma/tau
MATQSLYRRYRPRRFSELKGQDHVVRALREAVRAGREGQAYLFSGPRGTGKTTTARILAKVLNCTAPVDGEPCCECESCLSVERGTSYDVFELDAASNNSVDDIRSLIEKVSLGTPGRHKVYILDEVHMLGPGASAALLKVLEEPPPHVVFVLATTDPQRLKDTIRSRTQHLQFHLLPSDTLAEHIRWVAEDAGLDLGEEVLDAALAQGGGSARDTLSALELLAATGGDLSDRVDLGDFVRALVDADTGLALSAVAHAVGNGHDPRTLCEGLLRHLRDLFLSVMSPELVQIRNDRLDELAESARSVGTATIVRAMERLGTALVEMRFAPDPRIMLEVAMVQLTNASGDDVSALMSRLERLERQVASGAAATAAPAPAPAPRDPTTGRARVGGHARRDATGPTQRPAAAPEPAPAPVADEQPAAEPVAETPPPAATTAGRPPSADEIAGLWDDTVRPSLKPLVRALFSAASLDGAEVVDGVVHLRLGLPSAMHATKCEPHRATVADALRSALGMPVELLLGDGDGSRPASAPASTGSTSSSASASTPAAGSAVEPDEEIDLDGLTDAPPGSYRTPEQEVADVFPGSRMLEVED